MTSHLLLLLWTVYPNIPKMYFKRQVENARFPDRGVSLLKFISNLTLKSEKVKCQIRLHRLVSLFVKVVFPSSWHVEMRLLYRFGKPDAALTRWNVKQLLCKPSERELHIHIGTHTGSDVFTRLHKRMNESETHFRFGRALLAYMYILCNCSRSENCITLIWQHINGISRAS